MPGFRAKTCGGRWSHGSRAPYRAATRQRAFRFVERRLPAGRVARGAGGTGGRKLIGGRPWRAGTEADVSTDARSNFFVKWNGRYWWTPIGGIQIKVGTCRKCWSSRKFRWFSSQLTTLANPHSLAAEATGEQRTPPSPDGLCLFALHRPRRGKCWSCSSFAAVCIVKPTQFDSPVLTGVGGASSGV